MQRTLQDIKKLSNNSQHVMKMFFYYGYIPLIVYFGIKTVDWSQFSNPQM